MDLEVATSSPLVLTRIARYRSMASAPPSLSKTATATSATARTDLGVQIGGTVRNRAGEPVADVTVVPDGSGHGAVTGADGRYMLRGLAAGAVTLMVSQGDGGPKAVLVQVPGASYDTYDIVLDGE
jgi:hypothetical protein